MFETFFFIPFLFVAGVWGYILLKLAGNNRKIINDEFNGASEKQRKEARNSQRVIHLMTPVWVIVVAVPGLFLVNTYHPFIHFSIVGVALIAGGLFFTYLGWAIGMAIRGTSEDPKDKDTRFFSRAFFISFMGSGLVVTTIGILICISPFSALF